MSGAEDFSSSTFSKTSSPTSFKYILKLSLVLLISFSFVLQTNVTKPLAETLDATDTPKLFYRAIEQAKNSAQEMLSGVVEQTSKDLSQSAISESALSSEVPATNAVGEPFAWDAATKVLTIQGDCAASEILSEITNVANAVEEVCFSGEITITTDQSGSPFGGAANLKSITATDGTRVSFAADTASGAANPTLDSFFYSCGQLTSIDGLSTWDVSNVTGQECMSSIFSGCESLSSLDALSTWDVSNVTGDWCMQSMFSGCKDLTSLTGLSAWDVSNVTGKNCMQSMFSSCEALTSTDGLSTWDVSNVKGMGNMFSGCKDLTSLTGLSTWDVSNVTGDSCMASMFNGCRSLTSLTSLSTWDVSNVTDAFCMQSMFYGCTSLTSLDGLSAWDVSKVEGMYCMNSMFNGCTNLQDITGISSWNLASAKGSSGVNDMFSGCGSLASLTVDPSNGFELTSAMGIPTAFDTGGNTWWPMKGASAGCSTAEMVTNSADIATYGNRWIRNAPYVTDVEPSVTWTTTAKPYTGLNQTIGPDSVKVNGVELTPGVDYAVYYTKANTSVQEDANVRGGNPLQIDAGAYPVVREEGAYTAKLYLQGKYVGKENPSYTQTVYVGDPGPVPPGPTPGPEPTPTPEPTPASDGTLIPSTGDTTSMATAVLSLTAAALLGIAALGLALQRRRAILS